MSYTNQEYDLTGRLLAIDGLRGVAALAVVFHHLSGNLLTDLSQILPYWIMTSFAYGYLGVPVFFVLSGFVIAASVKPSTVTIQYVGRFALRRSIRLDLVYWAAIALALALLWVKHNVIGIPIDYPSMAEVAIHSFYLQDILQVENQISAVFWTLCLEIQFYLFFIVTFYIVGLTQSPRALLWHSIFIASVSVLSSFLYADVVKGNIPGFFLPFWAFFALGCLCYRSLKYRGYHSLLFFSVLTVTLATTFWSTKISFILAASAVAIFLYLLAIIGWLKNGLGNRYLQFLGLISYSLYLTHADIGWKTISILKKFISVGDKPHLAFLIFTAGVIVSIGFAYIFFKIIERPSHMLSKQIDLQSKSEQRELSKK